MARGALVVQLADGACPSRLMDPTSGDSKLEHRTELQAAMWGRSDCRLPSGVEDVLNLKQGTAAMVNLKELPQRPWRQRRQGSPGVAWLRPAAAVNAISQHIPRWGTIGHAPGYCSRGPGYKPTRLGTASQRQRQTQKHSASDAEVMVESGYRPLREPPRGVNRAVPGLAAGIV